MLFAAARESGRLCARKRLSFVTQLLPLSKVKRPLPFLVVAAAFDPLQKCTDRSDKALNHQRTTKPDPSLDTHFGKPALRNPSGIISKDAGFEKGRPCLDRGMMPSLVPTT
jgi:hypothetical protein